MRWRDVGVTHEMDVDWESLGPADDANADWTRVAVHLETELSREGARRIAEQLDKVIVLEFERLLPALHHGPVVHAINQDLVDPESLKLLLSLHVTRDLLLRSGRRECT